MLSKNDFKVHAAVLLLIANRDIKNRTKELDKINPMFIYGVLNDAAYGNIAINQKNPPIKSQYRSLSSKVASDKNLNLPDQATRVHQIVNKFNYTNVKPAEELSKENKKLLIEIINPKVVKKCEDQSVDYLYSCIFFINFNKKLSAFLLPAVVLLALPLLAGLSVIIFSFVLLYTIFIKPFLLLKNCCNSKKSDEEIKEVENVESYDEEEVSEEVKKRINSFQVLLFSLAVFFISVLALCLFPFFLIMFWKKIYRTPFISSVDSNNAMDKAIFDLCRISKEYLSIPESVKKAECLIQRQEWQEFRQRYFSDIEDAEIQSYLLRLKTCLSAPGTRITEAFETKFDIAIQ
ncbi:MAG: hypothetical protein HRK26_02480 [Rickettsiaceae bacterium H1]|nr:hypothetical protein [Rickettsiaceae bacterium H1]